MKSKYPIYFIVLILVFTPLIIFSNDQSWGGDFALYIDQAKAFWDGNIQHVLEQNRFGLENSSYKYYSPELYPWGWPILLSPVIKVAGLNYVWLKIVVMAFFIGMVIATYYLFSEKAGNTGSLLITATVAFNPALVEYTNNILSEIPFLFFVMMSLLLYETVKNEEKVGLGKIILAGFLFFYASIIRSEGFILFGAVVISEFIEWGLHQFHKQYLIDKKRLFQMAGVFGLFHIAYYLLLPGGSSSHFDHFMLTTWDTIIGNITFYYEHLDYCFSSFLKKSFVTVMLPFVAIGWYSRFRKDMEIAVYFLLLHILIVVWPHHEIRYLFIFIPFYFYFLFQGLQKINFPIKAMDKALSSARMIYMVFLIVMLLDFSFYLVRKSRQHEIVEGPETADARQMFAFITNETKKDDVIVFFKPRVMSLYTGHRSCIINDYPENLQQTGNYVVLHKQMGDYNQFNSLIGQPTDWLTKKLENSRFIVYQINPITIIK